MTLMSSLTTIPSLPPPPSSHSNRTTLVTGRVKRDGREMWANFINQASHINCYVSPINSPFGFNNLGGRLNNLCRVWVLLKRLQKEGGRGGDAVTQIASQRTVPLRMTVMKYNYHWDLLKNSSTAPRLPRSEGVKKKKNPTASLNW